MFKRNLLYSLIILLMVFSWPQAQVEELLPSGDCFIRTFGGGEGFNTFLKFDISSIGTGLRIDSVFLKAYIWAVALNWDGDASFWNVNSQTWQETDSGAVIMRIGLSDSTGQTAGFGTALGWTKSIDLKTIFLRDYEAGRTYCSFKIKDPDDMTFMPMTGSMPNNSNDTLGIGNRVFNQHIFFYPREYTVDTTRRTRLAIYYNLTGVETRSPKEFFASQLRTAPNPFFQATAFTYQVFKGGKYTLKIYNARGELVKTLVDSHSNPGRYRICWDGRDDKNKIVKSGIYFVGLKGNQLYTQKIVKVK